MFCPKDLLPCSDDLCRGSLTCFELGERMLDKCSGCGNLVSDEDHEDCTCDPCYDEEEPTP